MFPYLRRNAYLCTRKRCSLPFSVFANLLGIQRFKRASWILSLVSACSLRAYLVVSVSITLKACASEMGGVHQEGYTVGECCEVVANLYTHHGGGGRKRLPFLLSFFICLLVVSSSLASLREIEYLCIMLLLWRRGLVRCYIHLLYLWANKSNSFNTFHF